MALVIHPVGQDQGLGIGPVQTAGVRGGRRFRDAWHVATYVQDNIERLTERTRQFHKTLFDTTLPGYVLDAASSQISTIRTNTCLRLADGQFYGWEGCNDNSGCCAGTCMHVWNYAQTLAFLFPSLERSIRRNEFLNCTEFDGRMQFRTSMPANTSALAASARL